MYFYKNYGFSREEERLRMKTSIKILKKAVFYGSALNFETGHQGNQGKQASLLNTLQGFGHVDSHYLAAHKEVHDK